MKAYLFQGKTPQGKIIKGELDANNEIEARVKLRAQRIIPLKVMAKDIVKARKSSSGGGLFSLIGLWGVGYPHHLEKFHCLFLMEYS